MTSRTHATADHRLIPAEAFGRGAHEWGQIPNEAKAKIIPFLTAEGEHPYRYGGYLPIDKDSYVLSDVTALGGRSMRHHVVIEDAFFAPTAADLFNEIQQRWELNRAQEAIAQLQRENANLRIRNRQLRNQIRAFVSAARRHEAADPAIEIHGVEIPAPLAHFAPSIERSHAMVDLEDDWDGEGSLGYDEATWRRAVGLAVRCASRFVPTRDERVPAPAITKGPEGSVVVLWRWGSNQLMIDVPADDAEPVTYHGYDRANRRPETKGTLDLAEDNDWVLRWLSR